MSDGSNAGKECTAFSLKGAEIGVANMFNLLRAALIPPGKSAAFDDVGQLKLVLAVLVPTAVYVGLLCCVAGDILVTDPALEGRLTAMGIQFVQGKPSIGELSLHSRVLVALAYVVLLSCYCNSV